ncbi:C-type lectin domain family 4 member K, partial [Eschrichtius robustus]|nr:C-type lectin domain family 4 member K [Eschrichtius robustus]
TPRTLISAPHHDQTDFSSVFLSLSLSCLKSFTYKPEFKLLNTTEKDLYDLTPEPPPKTHPPLVLGRLLTVRAAVIFLTLVLAASVLLQAILYPWFMGTISDVKTNAQMLKGRVDNISTLSSEIKRNRDDILQMVSQGWKYFRGNFCYFSQIARTWYSAQQFCLSRDSHLTSVTSESEQEFLYRTAGGLLYWIGLSKAGSEGYWYWVDDSLFNKVQSAKAQGKGPSVKKAPLSFCLGKG